MPTETSGSSPGPLCLNLTPSQPSFSSRFLFFFLFFSSPFSSLCRSFASVSLCCWSFLSTRSHPTLLTRHTPFSSVAPRFPPGDFTECHFVALCGPDSSTAAEGDAADARSVGGGCSTSWSAKSLAARIGMPRQRRHFRLPIFFFVGTSTTDGRDCNVPRRDA